MANQKPQTVQSQPDVEVDFQPSDFSVVCGRGRDSFNHVGNRRFRILASMFIERYSRANSKAAKTTIVSEIIEVIRQADGNFCQYKKGKWFEVADHHAREKVSSLLRDLLHTQYRSSAKAKIARRKTAKSEIRKQKKQSGPNLVDGTPQSDDSSTLSSTEIPKQDQQNQQSEQKLVEDTAHSADSSTETPKQINQNQQSGQKLVDDTPDSDDSSMSSSCWGNTNDSLEIEYRLEDDFFDIEVFS
jgi:preprotein translocase subunit SecD